MANLSLANYKSIIKSIAKQQQQQNQRTQIPKKTKVRFFIHCTNFY